jgi:hypothetical protein
MRFLNSLRSLEDKCPNLVFLELTPHDMAGKRRTRPMFETASLAASAIF